MVDAPMASSDEARRRMEAQSQRDTEPEILIRRWLHGHGYRYRVDVRPESSIPRKADIVFRRSRVAVFVDGCFWHGCPEHMTWPKANEEWWRAKIAETRARDRDTTERLREDGWVVVRVWEHEDPQTAASRIAEIVDELAHGRGATEPPRVLPSSCDEPRGGE
jgi:DNA mismatch endonuclease (patch repair protein)